MSFKAMRFCAYLSLAIFCGLLSTEVPSAQQKPTQSSSTASTASARTFATPEEAMETLIGVAEKFDVEAIEQIFGSAGRDILVTAEPPRDRDIAHTFAELAREKKS